MKKKAHINSISVISSAVCNLKCSFCYLHKNKSYKEFDSIVSQAWENGDYLKNIKRTLKALNANFEDINTIQLWGGETLLNISQITKNVKNFYKDFPNIKEWKISTNFIIDIEKLIEFLLEIENNALLSTRIFLQLSIDGPPGEITNQGHHGNWEVYRRNIDKFTDLLNHTKLRKVHIDLALNATVNKELYFKIFSTYDGIKNYISYMKDFMESIDDKCVNKNFRVLTAIVFPGLAVPCNETTEEGIELAKIFRLYEYVRANEFPEIHPQDAFFRGTGDLETGRKILAPNQECSELNNSLTINPDGSIVECSGSFIDDFELYKKELQEDEEDLDRWYITKVRINTTANPGLMSEKELEKYNWYVREGFKNNKTTYLHCMTILCQELALSGQIPIKYYTNPELLISHLTVLANLNSCTRDNLANTKCPYCASVGTFRRYLNGALDYILDCNYNYKYLLENRRIKKYD